MALCQDMTAFSALHISNAAEELPKFSHCLSRPLRVRLNHELSGASATMTANRSTIDKNKEIALIIF